MELPLIFKVKLRMCSYGAFGAVLFWIVQYIGGLNFRPYGMLLENDTQGMFNMHPVLMILGLVFMCEGMLQFKNPIIKSTRSSRKSFHSVCVTIAMVLAWAGFTFVYLSKQLKKPVKGMHFPNIHSWFGIVTLSLMSIQLLAGALAYLTYSSPRFTQRINSLHRPLGISVLLCYATCCLLGLEQMIAHRTERVEVLLPSSAAVLVILTAGGTFGLFADRVSKPIKPDAQVLEVEYPLVNEEI